MIPENVMRELRYVEIYTAKKIRNVRVGTYVSPLRGSGFDFDEHRRYRPGDDIRRMDWNVTARMNVPYIKQTHEERELNVVIAMDLSRSMQYGTGRFSKKEVMTFIAGSLLFSAASDQINTGFMAFTDRVLSYSPPRAAKKVTWAILEDLWSLDPPEGRTKILPAVRHLIKELKRMSVIVLISDFFSDEDIFASDELKVLATRHDVIGVILEDPLETDLPGRTGFVRMRDMETGASVALGLGRRARQAYADAAHARKQELIRSFYRIGMDHVFVRSDQSFVEPLMNVFMKRKNR